MNFLKNVFKKFSFSKEVFVRFPLSYIFIILSLLFVLGTLQEKYYFSKDFDEKLILIFIISIISMTSLKLFFEIKSLIFIIKIFLVFLTIFFTILSVFYFKSTIIFYVLAVILTLTFSSFLFKKSSNTDFLSFLYQGLNAISFAFIGSVILAFGFFAISSSINYLFDIKFLTNYYSEVYSTIAIVVFPTIFLSNIKKIEDKFILNNSFLSLINNILIPILFIYIFILYSYFVKIVFSFELPKGNLTWMIIVFLSIGLFTKLSLLNFQNKGSFSKFYDKYYFYLTFVPLGFLFLAIYIRILEYGFTISRYSVLGLFIWLFFVSIFNIIKKDFNYKYIFISLSIILLFSSISPYNASKVSIDSQIKRLQTILIQNKILLNDKITPLKKQLKLEKRIQLSSIVSYLFYNSRNSKIALENFLGKEFKSKNEVLKYLNINDANIYTRKDKSYFENNTNLALDIKPFEHLLSISIDNYYKKGKDYFYFVNGEKKVVNIYLKENILKFNFNKKDELSFDMQKFILNLKEKNIKNFILEKSTKNIKIKLKINDINTRIKENSENAVDYINFILLFSINNKKG